MSKSVVVFGPTTENEASFVRTLLESYGIPVTVSSDQLVQRVYPTTLGEITVSVPEELEEEAMRIIEAHRTVEGDTTE